MKSRNDIEVLIEGRRYTICGFESEEYIQQIASYILLAINIEDDYFKKKKKARDYRTESQGKDKTVLDMKHKIIDLQDKEKKDEKKIDELEKELEDAEKKIIELETRLKQRK